MKQNIPTRAQFTKFNQNRKNPVTQIEPTEAKSKNNPRNPDHNSVLPGNIQKQIQTDQ